MDIQLADVTVHINESLDARRRESIESRLRAIDGVVSVHNPEERPHLSIIQYVPFKASSHQILSTLKAEGVHAELVGL